MRQLHGTDLWSCCNDTPIHYDIHADRLLCPVCKKEYDTNGGVDEPRELTDAAERWKIEHES